MTTETERWKNIAIYLADCHAANLRIAELKSTSKMGKVRLKNIMIKATNMLKGLDAPRSIYAGDKTLADVIERLEDHSGRIK